MEACALNNLFYYYTKNNVCKKVRGRHYDYVLKIGGLEKFRKFHKKTPALESHFNKAKKLKRDSSADISL